MGANQSTYTRSRCKSALRVLESIKPNIPSTSSQLYLLKYLHAYISSALSQAKPNYLSLRALSQKLQKYINVAIQSPLARNNSSRFHIQFDDDRNQLGRQLSYVHACNDDLELYEQILTAVRRKSVLCFREFVIERPKVQIAKVRSEQLMNREELETSINNGPAGGYVSMKDGPQVKEVPWWENGKERAKSTSQSAVKPYLARRHTSLIQSAPDPLRIRNNQGTTQPLFQSRSTREPRSKLQHPGFSYAGIPDPTNFSAPPCIRPSNRVSSVASTVLDSRDWPEAEREPEPVSKFSSPSTTTESSSPKTEREGDSALPNVRHSWTSSVHSSIIPSPSDDLIVAPDKSLGVSKSCDSGIGGKEMGRHEIFTTLNSAPSLRAVGGNAKTPEASMDAEEVDGNSTADLFRRSTFGRKVGTEKKDKDVELTPQEDNLGEEEKFEAVYRVKEDFDRALDGVRVTLSREDLVQVRVERSGSYVKVNAWVPLASVYNALDFDEVRDIRRSS